MMDRVVLAVLTIYLNVSICVSATSAQSSKHNYHFCQSMSFVEVDYLPCAEFACTGLYVATHVVTREAFVRVYGNWRMPFHHSAKGVALRQTNRKPPIVDVSIFEALKFCNELSI